MGSTIFKWLKWIFALAVLGGFFLPWLKLESTSVARSTEKLVTQLTKESDQSWFALWFGMTREEQKRAMNKPLDGTSGYQMPLLFQKEKSAQKTALINSHLFGTKRMEDRVYAVYAFPITAFFAAAFLTFSLKRWVLFIPLITIAVIYGTVRYQLNVTYFDRLASNLDVGLGLWISLYSLLALGILLVISFLMPSK